MQLTHSLYPKLVKAVCSSLASIVPDLSRSKLHWRKQLKYITLYYIKVSGIASGNKLIKAIRYPHMWRYRWLRWYQVCLLNCTEIRWCIIETSSGLPRKSSVIFGHLRKFSEILGKCSGTFVWPSEQFWKIFRNLWKVVWNLRKIIKNAVISMFYTIKRTLHVSSKIWISCSRGTNNISLVRCAHSWDIVLATRTKNSYLLATV